MTKGMTEKQMDAALLIPIPTRYGRKEFLDASEIANAMVFLLSPLASGINGVILFVGRRHRRAAPLRTFLTGHLNIIREGSRRYAHFRTIHGVYEKRR